jgi:hypothetical protein
MPPVHVGKGSSGYQLLWPPGPFLKDYGPKQEERAEAANVLTGVQSIYAPRIRKAEGRARAGLRYTRRDQPGKIYTVTLHTKLLASDATVKPLRDCEPLDPHRVTLLHTTTLLHQVYRRPTLAHETSL